MLNWRVVTQSLASFTGIAFVVSAPGSAWAQERAADWTWGMHPMSWMWGAWGVGMMVMMLLHHAPCPVLVVKGHRG